MGSKNDITPFSSGRESEGLGWADQWDYKYSDSAGGGDELSTAPANTKKDKMADLSKKAKAAANTGLAKAKVGASFAATKMSAGMSAGVEWVKNRQAKNRAAKANK